MRKRIKLDDLRFVGEVIDKLAQRRFVGGYKFTDKGYYLFTQSELETLYGTSSNIPDVFGTGALGCWDADGQKSELFYKVSKRDFDSMFPNGCFYDGKYSQGYVSLYTALGAAYYGGERSWSYGGYANSGYYYDPFDSYGSYHNPYSERDYQTMLKNSTWDGGYVFGRGYVFRNTTCVASNGQIDSTTYADMFGTSSNVEGWVKAIANCIISSVPGVGVASSILQSRMSDMMTAIMKNLSMVCSGTSNLIVTRDYPNDNVTIMYIRVYNQATSDKMIDYRIDMNGFYHNEK